MGLFNFTTFPFQSTLQVVLTRHIVTIIKLCWMLNTGKRVSCHCVDPWALYIMWEFNECQLIPKGVFISGYIEKVQFLT